MYSIRKRVVDKVDCNDACWSRRKRVRVTSGGDRERGLLAVHVCGVSKARRCLDRDGGTDTFDA